MKHSMHVQPSQFEFIGFEYEASEGLSDEAIEAAISDYRRARRSLEEGPSKEGLPRVEWNKVKVNYARGLGMSTEQNEMMSKAQKWWISEYDKLLAMLEKYNRE